MGKHDLQFRKSFKDPELFRQACEIYLPDEIKSKLNVEIKTMNEEGTRTRVVQKMHAGQYITIICI